MKTRIVSTRIPAAQANGVYNISLPTGFGVPKGFLVYATNSFVQPNNFDSTTDFPGFSVGFGGSNIAGTGLTNCCAWITQQEDAEPTEIRAGFANTASIFITNIADTVRRQWQLTGFANDLILGTYQGVGTQQTPLDVVFTVFSGDDFFAAVGRTAVTASGVRTVVGTTFQPDAILFSSLRPATTTDGNIHFGTALRNASTGATTCRSQVSASWGNQRNQDPVECLASISDAGSRNVISSASIKFQHMFASGFAVTQDSANAHSIIFLAMKAGVGLSTNPSFSANTFQSATGVGSSYYEVGFKPNHIIGCFSHVNTLNSNVNSTANGADMMSFFTASGAQKANIVGIGTFTSSTSSTTLTGVGTSFLQQLGAVDNIYNLNYNLVGIVSSITSNTSLLLQSNAAITATGSSFIYEKPLQFSFGYGAQDAAGNGNNTRGRFSDTAITSFTASTPTLQAVGSIQNFDGQNGFTVNYTTLANGGRFGWYLAIRDEDFYRRRRVNS
jgi:hypothetical protein